MLKTSSCMLLALCFHGAVQAKVCDSLGSLSWLLGNWVAESGKSKISESWQQISDKTFEGAGVTYSLEKQKIVSSETLRLVEMSGEVFYLAKVASNHLPVAFKLTQCTAESAVFENPQHDFPKKLHYQLTKDKRIIVVVSGENENGFSINFIPENNS